MKDNLAEELMESALMALSRAKISTWDLDYWVMNPCLFDQLYYLTNNNKFATVAYSGVNGELSPYFLGIHVKFDKTKSIHADWHELVSSAVLLNGVKPEVSKSDVKIN